MTVAALLLPTAATAVTISSSSQLDIAAVVDIDNSTFDASGTVEFINPGFVVFSANDFAGITPGSLVTLTNVDFTTPGALWAIGGFTYTITAFTSIFDGLVAGFTADGVVSGNGYEDTETAINFTVSKPPSLSNVTGSVTTSPVPLPTGLLLLGTALAGFGLFCRKSRRA